MSAADDFAITPPMCAIFRRYLKSQGHKFTTERALILDAVLDRKGVFEAEELIDALRHSGRRASKATIYRTLKHMVESGILRQVLLEPGRAHYRVAYGKQPMGQMHCVDTGVVIEFPLDIIREQIDGICKAHGFKPHATQLVIHGLSKTGQERQAQEPDS